MAGFRAGSGAAELGGRCAAGVVPPATIPGVTGCPWCGAPRLAVYHAPAGGRWHRCGGCRRAWGDAPARDRARPDAATPDQVRLAVAAAAVADPEPVWRLCRFAPLAAADRPDLFPAVRLDTLRAGLGMAADPKADGQVAVAAPLEVLPGLYQSVWTNKPGRHQVCRVCRYIGPAGVWRLAEAVDAGPGRGLLVAGMPPAMALVARAAATSRLVPAVGGFPAGSPGPAACLALLGSPGLTVAGAAGDGAALAAAAACDGRFVDWDGDWEGGASARDLAQSLCDRADDWRAVARRWAARLPPAVWAAAVEQAGDWARRLSETAGGWTRPAAPAGRVQLATGQVVEEDADGWWRVMPRGRRAAVWPVPVRLDRQVAGRFGCEYEGRVVRRGMPPHPFRVACGELEDNPRRVLADVCREAGVAVGPTHGRAGVCLLACATAFAPLDQVVAVDPAAAR